MAAAEVFNALGLAGADARRIAHAAGYSSGVFYKHFRDKRGALIAAYDAWVAAEWDAIGAATLSEGEAGTIAASIVEQGAALHAQWRGLRAAMMALVAVDPEAAKAYRVIQQRQLAIVGTLRTSLGHPAEALREADAVLMMAMERVFDALASDELEPLGLDRAKVLARIIDMAAEALARPASA